MEPKEMPANWLLSWYLENRPSLLVHYLMPGGYSIESISVCAPPPPSEGGFAPFWSETGYQFCPFWSGVAYGFRGNYGRELLSSLSRTPPTHAKKYSVVWFFSTQMASSFARIRSFSKNQLNILKAYNNNLSKFVSAFGQVVSST